jgi:hypothetical protein
MWQIEQERYVGGKTRWQPVKGARYTDRGAADTALGVVVRRALKDAAASGQARTDRFRVVLAAIAACLVLQ